MHRFNCFITLTYSDEHLPDNGSLVVGDWQAFAKAWRNKLGKFRFFHCGEYGDKNGRPHYHAAIFGHDFHSDRRPARPSKKGHPQWSSPTLDKLWGKGEALIGTLNFESAGYVARYIMKKQTGPDAYQRYGEEIKLEVGTFGTYHCRLGLKLKPEYTTMSRRPGLGADWIKKYHHEVYGQGRDEVLCNGHFVNPPKFYDSFYEKHNPAGYRKLKARRRRNTKLHEDNNTADRLIVREKVQVAKIRSLTRSL